MIWLPARQDVLRLHEKLIERTGGSEGIRDIGLIESALARSEAGFGEMSLYPGVVDKAAAIGCGLAKNHGFVDGNKRIGVAVMLLILRRNAVQMRFTQAELIELGLGIARGKLDVSEVKSWIEKYRVDN